MSTSSSSCVAAALTVHLMWHPVGLHEGVRLALMQAVGKHRAHGLPLDTHVAYLEPFRLCLHDLNAGTCDDSVRLPTRGLGT